MDAKMFFEEMRYYLFAFSDHYCLHYPKGRSGALSFRRDYGGGLELVIYPCVNADKDGRLTFSAKRIVVLLRLASGRELLRLKDTPHFKGLGWRLVLREKTDLLHHLIVNAPNCHGCDCRTLPAQRRRADKPPDIFYRCPGCDGRFPPTLGPAYLETLRKSLKKRPPAKRRTKKHHSPRT